MESVKSSIIFQIAPKVDAITMSARALHPAKVVQQILNAVAGLVLSTLGSDIVTKKHLD